MIDIILSSYKDGTYFVVSGRVYDCLESAKEAVLGGFVKDDCIEHYYVKDGKAYFMGGEKV